MLNVNSLTALTSTELCPVLNDKIQQAYTQASSVCMRRTAGRAEMGIIHVNRFCYVLPKASIESSYSDFNVLLAGLEVT